MDDVKKRLKILLRPGEPEKRPELTWPKSMKKEPVEVVKEVIELLCQFRDIMRHNWETMDVDRIQERWCCGDEPWLFRERWEKLFEDFCDVKQEKFDPSRVSELYDTIKYCALHHRTFLFSIFSEHGNGVEQPVGQDRRLHELYSRAKALFDLVAPQEYGIEPEEKYVLTPPLNNHLRTADHLRQGGDRRADISAAPAERRQRSRARAEQRRVLLHALLHERKPHPYARQPRPALRSAHRESPHTGTRLLRE